MGETWALRRGHGTGMDGHAGRGQGGRVKMVKRQEREINGENLLDFVVGAKKGSWEEIGREVQHRFGAVLGQSSGPCE